MLTTVRDGETGLPFPLARTDPPGDSGHPIEHFVHVGDDVATVDLEAGAAGHTECDVTDRPVLGGVDVLAGEHRVAQLLDAGPACDGREQREGLVGHPVLGDVDEKVRGRKRHPTPAVGVLGEELPQMPIAEDGVVLGQAAPLVGGRDVHQVTSQVHGPSILAAPPRRPPRPRTLGGRHRRRPARPTRPTRLDHRLITFP